MLCLHRNAAAIAAIEDEGIFAPAQGAAGLAGGGLLPLPFAALLTPVTQPHTQLSAQRIHFDPVGSMWSGAGLEGAGAGRSPDPSGTGGGRRQDHFH